MTFRPLSRLSPAEREAAERLLSANPVLALYWATAIEDLAGGVDNRLVRFAKGNTGIIFGAVFGDLTVFSFCGDLADGDIAASAAVPGAVELHVPADDAARYQAIAGRRLAQSRDMLLMASPTAALRDNPADCRDLGTKDATEIAEFYRTHYPETVFDPYMLSMPFVGAFIGGRLVASAGTIALSTRLQTALIGHFVTMPQARGQGLAFRLGQALLDRMAGRGFVTTYLATTADNKAAVRTYEKLGFATMQRLVQLDLMP